MEQKLELKHIAPYLPYGLKGAACCLDGYYEPIELGELMRIETGITRSGDTGEVWLVLDDIEVPIIEFKPILRPLSDLKNIIEVNGEKFVPIERLFEIKYPELVSRGREYYIEFVPNWVLCSGNWTATSLKISLSDIYSNYYWLVQKLIEWHFDIFGLIEKGLAIDINTLKK
jgi:hypothetical protein